MFLTKEIIQKIKQITLIKLKLFLKGKKKLMISFQILKCIKLVNIAP